MPSDIEISHTVGALFGPGDVLIHGLPPIPAGWAARRFRLLPPVAHEFMEILSETARQWEDIPGVRIIASH
jgi:hypothetical protein